MYKTWCLRSWIPLSRVVQIHQTMHITALCLGIIPESGKGELESDQTEGSQLPGSVFWITAPWVARTIFPRIVHSHYVEITASSTCVWEGSDSSGQADTMWCFTLPQMTPLRYLMTADLIPQPAELLRIWRDLTFGLSETGVRFSHLAVGICSTYVYTRESHSRYSWIQAMEGNRPLQGALSGSFNR